MTQRSMELVEWYERSLVAGAPCATPDSSTLERWWRTCADARVMMALAARFEARPVLVTTAADIVASVLSLLRDRRDDARKIITNARKFTDGSAMDAWRESVQELVWDVSRANRAPASSAYAASALVSLVDLATLDERAESSASEVAATAAMAAAARAEESQVTLDAFIERDAHLAWAAGVIRERIRCPTADDLEGAGSRTAHR